MTAPETPAALLRRAAEKVETAAAAEPTEPWAVSHVRAVLTSWVGLMSPEVGAPLAAWFRAEAEDLTWDEQQALDDCQDCQGTGEVYDADPLPFTCSCRRRVGEDRPSVALAYAILREKP